MLTTTITDDTATAPLAISVSPIVATAASTSAPNVHTSGTTPQASASRRPIPALLVAA